MRLVLFIAGLWIGLMGLAPGGDLSTDLGPAPAVAFNPLKFCVDKCVLSGSASISKCERNHCADLKSKSKRRKCERSCNKPQGLLKYCDTTCKKSQVCTQGLEMKACMKEKCDPYRKSDIHRYIKCKNEDCGAICK